MGVLPDWMIERDVKINPAPAPVGAASPKGQISSGYSSYGFDARCGYKFKVFSPIHAAEIDPKNFDPAMLEDIDLTPHHRHDWYMVSDLNASHVCRRCKDRRLIHGHVPMPCLPDPSVPKFLRIPPHSFALAETLETYTIPRDCLVICLGKSTYARCGLIVNVTPLEPEWTGKVTLELSNTTPLPVRVYAGEGICQFVFLRSDGVREATSTLTGFNRETPVGTCQVSYADKKGKYQHQSGITPPKVEGSN